MNTSDQEAGPALAAAYDRYVATLFALNRLRCCRTARHGADYELRVTQVRSELGQAQAEWLLLARRGTDAKAQAG